MSYSLGCTIEYYSYTGYKYQPITTINRYEPRLRIEARLRFKSTGYPTVLITVFNYSINIDPIDSVI